MSTTAHVAHATRGRARLRLPTAKGDKVSLERIAKTLRQCPTVTDVAVSAATASVLVHHGGELDDVVAHARAHDLFELENQPGRRDVIEGLKEALLRTNTSLRRRTAGAADLRTFAFAALVGGSAYQLFRGEFLPAGGTMLMQALDIVLGTQRRHE